jgi:hypothetical protein
VICAVQVKRDEKVQDLLEISPGEGRRKSSGIVGGVPVETYWIVCDLIF